MAIYINVVRDARKEIEDNLQLNDVIDMCIAQKIIDEKLYTEIWSYPHNRVHYLLDVILKDGKNCAKFIHILGNIAHMKTLSKTILSDIDKIRKVIVLGGFPEFSLNYVVRNSVANKIEQRAFELDPSIGGILVVHGLPGFGKSCLVNQVLQTKRFLEVSGGAMFWINLGEHQDTTTVINPLWNLYLNAVQLIDKTPLSHRPDDINLLQAELRRVFLDDHLKNAYIILDDVKSAEVLKVFKLRCRVIVTTQDKNIANVLEAIFIKVTTGFTKKESLELLRKSLEVDDLNDREKLAYKIHELCDGCPMLLNIIGSILKDSKEEALTNNIIWDSIIDEMKRNDRLTHPTTENVIHMIQKFVTCLKPAVQQCFHSLAVFPKHVNIRPEILMRLWNEDYYTVRNIMVELENKSLVVSFFNNDLEVYIYSIHSLVRTYLVEVAETDVKDYHRKMISKFEDVIDRPLMEDPCANYIYGYYGYHAKNADLYDMFDKYFDLKFIENKIKRVGSADLLTDFEVYKNFITKNDLLLERKLQDYINFVNFYSAHLHVSPETNIVQFAFFNCNSYVGEEAKIIANQNPDQLYFNLDNYSGKNEKSPILKARNVATAACFVACEEVLVGTSTGTIETKSFRQYQHKVYPFEGHTHKITSIQISPDEQSFLSISEDHTVKLWHFSDDLDPQSPKCKQRNWKNLHSPDESLNQHKTFEIQEDFIVSGSFPNNNSDEIVTASNKGRIVRWNTRTGSIIKQSPELGLRIHRIIYTHDNTQVMFSCDGKIFLNLRESLMYNGQFGVLDHLEFFNDLILTPVLSKFMGVVAVSGRYLEIWDYVLRKKEFFYHAYAKITSVVVHGEYLIFGTVNHIFIYNFELEQMSQYKNDYGEPTCLYVLSDRIAYICLSNDTIQRCELYLEPTEKPIVKNIFLFNCHWKDSLPIYFTVDEMNKIDIFNGHSSILSGIDTITEKIKTATFSLCGNYLILGTEKGYVYFYNYKRNHFDRLKICTSEISLIRTFESDVKDCYESSGLHGLVVAASGKKVAVIADKKILFDFAISQQLTHIFYLSKHLIVIDIDSNIFLGNLFNDNDNWVSEKTREVVVADVHETNKLLAVVGKEGNSYILEVHELFSDDAKTVITNKELTGKPNCLSFSSSGKLLALGCDCGDIEVFNLENKLHKILALHKRSVERVLFAPNLEPILVSVGDKIAWWNLQSFHQYKIEKKSKTGVDNIKHQLSLLTFDNWTTKKLHETVPYLVTSTNLHGKQLKFISASKDFHSFLTVDEDGNIFKVDKILNS